MDGGTNQDRMSRIPSLIKKVGRETEKAALTCASEKNGWFDRYQAIS
jgi:hypothetical protein